MFFIDRLADEKRRDTENRRAGKCGCGAQMQYAGGGVICTASRKSREACDNNRTGQTVRNMVLLASSTNHRSG